MAKEKMIQLKILSSFGPYRVSFGVCARPRAVYISHYYCRAPSCPEILEMSQMS